MKHLLVVEDNAMSRDMLCRRLQRRGYRVTTAEDGAQALERVRAELPDLVLMDLSLPVIDGWEVTRQLKLDPRTAHIPILALTAHAMAGDEQGALAAGCDGYDTKPIDLARLLGAVERLLSPA